MQTNVFLGGSDPVLGNTPYNPNINEIEANIQRLQQAQQQMEIQKQRMLNPPTQQALELKSRLINSVEIWAEERVDSFVSGNTAFKPLGKYLKGGVHNMIVQKDKEITEKVEGFMLFVADENGNYDKEELFDDAMNVFKSMKPYKFEQGFIKGTIGEGSILIELPDNGLMNFILGDTNAIRITEADFLELKSIFTE